MSLEHFKTFRKIDDAATAEGDKSADQSRLFANLSMVSQEDLRLIHDTFGDQGLLKLYLLAVSSEPRRFQHFYALVLADLHMRNEDRDDEIALEPDNVVLGTSSELDQFCHNVINCSLSRKLFNPGVREGYLVYGLGGPRILVSLPFIGAGRYFYDVFGNSSDVVTSLMSRGYRGTFLLLDSVEGLNKVYHGQRGWLLWFSKIASNCDLVLFAAEEGKGLNLSQQMEASFVPDRVTKKIVLLRQGELSWAHADDIDPSAEAFHFTEDGRLVSKQEWEASTAQLAEPFIQSYRRNGEPKNKLFVFHENGTHSELPLPRRTRARRVWPW